MEHGVVHLIYIRLVFITVITLVIKIKWLTYMFFLA